MRSRPPRDLVIGYYVHHQGRGHLHRALAIAEHLRHPVTGLSSLMRPLGWRGEWLRLPRDDAAADVAIDPRAHGILHWAPRRDIGLRQRMARIAAWIETDVPDLLVADVSVEVALLARLHGIPLAAMVLPGVRDDAPHHLVHSVASGLIGAWPEAARGVVLGLPPGAEERLHAVGAIGRFPPVPVDDAPSIQARAVTVLHGAGGSAEWESAAVSRRAPDWTWRVLGPGAEWTDNPWPALVTADVVVTHAGQNGLAEVAAARRPAVVIPQDRPFGEQHATASVLAAGRWPAVVCSAREFAADPAGILARAARLDGAGWSTWNDGRGAVRAAALLDEEADRA